MSGTPRLRQVRKLPKLPARRRDAHKGDFGRVLVVGGSVGMAGAAGLAANAALRGGAGLVKVACPAPVLATIAGIAPCATTLSLPADAQGRIAARAGAVIIEAASQHDVLAVGPGLAQSPALVALLRKLIGRVAKPLVIDADGLNNLAKIKNWPAACRATLILTPHPGEMRRLLAGAGLACNPKQRVEAVSALARWCEQVVLLKGAGTLVCDGRRLYKNKTGNPGMATGGSGDVLTGLVAALIRQGLAPFEAACLGAHLHGLAGDLAAKKLGEVSLTAGDLIDHLPPTFARYGAASRT